MSGWAAYSILFLAGLASGAVNVVAGGGSFLTLPVLIFAGLPATVANGTNRVAILLQNVGAVWGFHRHRVLDWRWALWSAVPAAAGALLGTWAALTVPDEAFKRILALLMVAITLWTLLDPTRHRRQTLGTTVPGSGPEPAGRSPGARRRAVALALGFFAVGVYGGFIQAGVGFLVLTVTTLAGLDLVRGNAVKVLNILVFTGLSLAIFVLEAKVHWPSGLVLAAGSVLGGLIGVRLTVVKGHRWVQGVVTATVILFALKLWFSP